MKLVHQIVLCFQLVACNSLDLYAERFQAISIGDSRARAVEVMGTPDSVNSFEVPLMSVTQLAWRSNANGRVYVIHTVVDRVVTKSVIQ